MNLQWQGGMHHQRYQEYLKHTYWIAVGWGRNPVWHQLMSWMVWKPFHSTLHNTELVDTYFGATAVYSHQYPLTSFYRINHLHTVSKADLKSTKQANKYFRGKACIYLLMIFARDNIWSVVRDPFLYPIWFGGIRQFASAYDFRRLWIIVRNNLAIQLDTAMPR